MAGLQQQAPPQRLSRPATLQAARHTGNGWAETTSAASTPPPTAPTVARAVPPAPQARAGGAARRARRVPPQAAAMAPPCLCGLLGCPRLAGAEFARVRSNARTGALAGSSAPPRGRPLRSRRAAAQLSRARRGADALALAARALAAAERGPHPGRPGARAVCECQRTCACALCEIEPYY